MNKMIRNLLLSALLVFPVLQSCVKEETVIIPSKADDRVYFIYMAADNSLGGYAVQNLGAIERTTSWQNIGEGRVLVFYDPSGNEPCKMLEYKAGPDKKPMKTELAVYTDMNTASPATFEFAVSEMKRFATSGGRRVSSYILDLWSHGNSWEPMTPAPASQSIGIAPTAVAQDGSHWLNLEDFANAVEPGLFEAIIFAECYGSSVEMMYLLRDKTKYIVGSAAEMPAYGLQYNRVLPFVFEKEFNYQAFCQSYYDYWKNTNPFTATIAWFDCREFTDDFIDVMAEIYASSEYDQLLRRMNGAASVSGFEVQFYDRPHTNSDNSNIPKKYFDLGDMVNRAFEPGSRLHTRFWEAYNKIVKYAASTQTMWEVSVDPTRFSGMTAYMMLEWSNPSFSSYIPINTNYRDTKWYQEVYP